MDVVHSFSIPCLEKDANVLSHHLISRSSDPRGFPPAHSVPHLQRRPLGQTLDGRTGARNGSAPPPDSLGPGQLDSARGRDSLFGARAA